MKPHEIETVFFEYDPDWDLTSEQIAERARIAEEEYENAPME